MNAGNEMGLGLSPYRQGPESELAKWIDQQRTEGVTRFLLRQRAEDVSESFVREFSWRNAETSVELAEMIQRRAQIEARNFRGRQVYGVQAFRDRDYVDRFYFTIDGAPEDPAAAVREANVSSLLLQFMKHDEVKERLLVGNSEQVIDQYKDLLRITQERLQVVEAKLWEAIADREYVETKKHERVLERMRLEQEARNQDFLKERVDQLIPFLLARMAPALLAAPAEHAGTGEDVLSPAQAPTTQEAPMPEARASRVVTELRRLFRSLSADQLVAVSQVLRPEQLVLLNELSAEVMNGAAARAA